MSEFIKKYHDFWGGNPRSILKEYNYQKSLTARLDGMDLADLNRERIYEIVLWKLNRFPVIDDSLIEDMKSLGPPLSLGGHKECEKILHELLRCKGIALPMASTILRFVNSSVFQIIDDRVYRVLFPGENKYPSKPVEITEGYLDNSVKIYFRYLDKLNEICDINLPFVDADRILYKLDIEIGNKIGDKNSKE